MQVIMDLVNSGLKWEINLWSSNYEIVLWHWRMSIDITSDQLDYKVKNKSVSSQKSVRQSSYFQNCLTYVHVLPVLFCVWSQCS